LAAYPDGVTIADSGSGLGHPLGECPDGALREARHVPDAGEAVPSVRERTRDWILFAIFAGVMAMSAVLLFLLIT
jgi:hypothetical protein